MSKESPPVREVVPFKAGKRRSTFRKLNLDFAGTALEEALARQEQQGETVEPEAEEVKNPTLSNIQLTPVTGVTGVKNEPALTELTPVTPVTPVTGVKEDAAPRRDFTRAANSIVRDAIPAGVFTGKGKHLYDYLYSQTRGAIVPVHSARIPTEKVMSGAGMTRNTFRLHLERLCNAGLIEVDQRPGEHGGNIYTVRLPEEIGLQKGNRGDRGDRGDRGQNLPLVQGSEVDPGDRGLSLTFTDNYGEPKTFIKTIEKNDDDEAFARFVAALAKAARELTGKATSAAEAERWEELGEVLITELRMAAGRTSVSSVPAFLSEHLRRRLWKRRAKTGEAEQHTQDSPARPPAHEPSAAGCPDCYGTGMYYPEGFDKGVAKCSHPRLREREVQEGDKA
ncbi:MAG TPA: hypothetical protein VGX48_14040 [Pyrinomonadaceae bacterium]|nr:hypothetical protein [Pyrinomonadaceae bacterium]